MNRHREYLVQFGTAGHLARFRATDDTDFGRGDRVVVRSSRGLELGDILAESSQAIPFPDGFVGELMRRATNEDVLEADRDKALGSQVCNAAEELALNQRLPLAILDVEVSLDGRQVILHVLKTASFDEGPWLSDIGDRFGRIVRLYDLAQDRPHNGDAEEHESKGCESCGTEGCGSCGDGGGCSSCSSGAAKELAEYFATLRERMHRQDRLPLL